MFISGQLIGSYENGKVVLPAVEVLELLRLPSGNTIAPKAANASPSRSALTLSPTSSRVMRNLNLRAGGKIPRLNQSPAESSGAPNALGLPFPVPSAKRLRASLPSERPVGVDPQGTQLRAPVRGDNNEGTMTPILVSSSSSISTVSDHPLESGFGI